MLWPTLRALEQVARMPTPLSPAALGKRFTSQLCSRRRLQPLLLTRLRATVTPDQGTRRVIREPAKLRAWALLVTLRSLI